MASLQLHSGAVSVFDYRCDLGPGAKPFAEMHHGYSIAYVRRGSFACTALGHSYDLIAGSLMIGRPGDEYVCSHDHHACGDECLHFRFSPELADAITPDRDFWRARALPPMPEAVVAGELAQAVADGRSDISLEEAGLLLASRFAATKATTKARRPAIRGIDRRRMVETAEWIDTFSHQPINLESAAARNDLSPFHFLRLFTRVLGVSPHQYLVRSRLRHAARKLAEGGAVTDVALDVGFGDLSNFVRTFRRAAGVSPGIFRRLARGDRNIVAQWLDAASL
jgi:AraC family transcriptional regulator